MEGLRIFSDGGGRVGGGELRELSTAEAEAGLWVADKRERGRTRIGHFLRKNGQDIRQVGLVHRYLQGGLDVVLHRPSPAVKGPSAELVHQVFPDRSPRDRCKNGFSGLLASTDVAGEQDGIGEDLLPQIRALQDPSPGLLRRLELALELLDPLVPLGEGLFKGRHFSTVDFVPILSPGEEISDGVSHLRDYRSAAEVYKKARSLAMRSPTKAVDHPLVFSGGGDAAQILDSRAVGGSSPCFISTSITGVVDPDPLEGCVVAKGSPVGTGASALGSDVFAGSAFLAPRLIFFAGAGGRAETGKLLIVPENQKHKRD
nr:hypothetical protein Iba_chr02eCG9020 [Ipomoea batatas]